MTIASRASWLIPVFLATVLPSWGCGAADPPLDQLELRDALVSDPVVIAGLSHEAQQRLAGRFWAAVALPESAQSMPSGAASSPEQRLRRLDAQRQQRGQDAFLLGVLSSDAAAMTLSPFYCPARSSPAAPLPPLLGRAAGATQAQEARALAGRAGAAIEDLRNVSGAAQLERVTGWPTAVIALQGRIYVNATWLTAVAALEPGESPGPAQSGALSRSGTSGGRLSLYGGLVALPEGGAGLATSAQALSTDAVEATEPPSDDPAASGGFGSCSSCSSSSCSSSSCNSSSSTTPSSCTVNLCSSAADKECCRACALAPERAGPDLSMLWMMLWLSVPLVLLAAVDLRSRVQARVRARDPRAPRGR